MEIDVGAKIEFKWLKEEISLDPKLFPESRIKEKEIGLLRKKIYYIHHKHDGSWDVLQLSPTLRRFYFK